MELSNESPSVFATPRPRTSSQSEGPGKKDLVGALIICTLDKYEMELPTSFGTTTAAFLTRLVVVTGDAMGVYQDWAAFGLMGRQIGEALLPGETAPARVVAGESKGSRPWIGVDFMISAEDRQAALDAFKDVLRLKTA